VTVSPGLPYPGLRSFRRDEIHLFFGRDRCIDALIERLGHARFLAVLGSSGTGKSSLVKTGLLSALEMGLLKGAGSRWRVVDFQPGKPTWSPMRNLAQRLVETSDEPWTAKDVDALESRLRSEGPRALLRWCGEGNLPPDTNLLLLIDQFEELFRRDDRAGREEAEAFVSLLLESKHPMEVSDPRMAAIPIFVTLTMRSEYLGACSLIPGLSEAINESVYLTPRMTREECREAIVGPARVCGFDLEPRLANRILNDLANFMPWDAAGETPQSDSGDAQDQLNRVARRADQLPIMQHALNQVWQKARDATPGAAVRPLTVEDYDAVGGVSGALDRHANRIFDGLPDSQKPIAEAIFRALTLGTTVASAIRRPIAFDELVRTCGGDEQAVRDVVGVFRSADCNFLQPESATPLQANTIIDITHESLIRQWSKLRGWVEKEAKIADTYRDLERRAKRWKNNEEELLTMPYLASIIDWRDKTSPTKDWSLRYGDDFDLTRDYALKSEAAEKEREEARVAASAARNRILRRRTKFLAFAAAALSLIVLSLVATTVRFPSLASQYELAIASIISQASQKISQLLGAPVSPPQPTGTVASSQDILQNIVLAANGDPPNFTSVRMDAAFLNRFLKPADLATIHAFIGLGYSRELLFALFADTIQLTLPGKSDAGQTFTFTYHYNPPDDYGCSQTDPKHRCYIDWIRLTALTGLNIEQKTAMSSDARLMTVFSRFCFDQTLAQQVANSVPAAAVEAATNDLDIVPALLYQSQLACGDPGWNPTTNRSVLQPSYLSLVLGPLVIAIVPRSPASIFQFLGNLLRIQNQKIQPSPSAFIPASRAYVTSPPTLLTAPSDPNLLTILSGTQPPRPAVGATTVPCFVTTEFNKISYCVPDQALTTKAVFSLLAQLMGQYGPAAPPSALTPLPPTAPAPAPAQTKQ
jgi:hypothetical protein